CKELSPDADKKDKADQEQRGNDPTLLQELLANKDKHVKNADQMLNELTDLIKVLREVLSVIERMNTDDAALEALIQIEATHRELDLFLRRYQSDFRAWIIRQIGGGG